jgi:hypothetical protein
VGFSLVAVRSLTWISTMESNTTTQWHRPSSYTEQPNIAIDGDVSLWLVMIAGIDPRSPRAAYYAKWWDVFGKIERAKACGQWPPTPANQERY